MGKLLLPVLGMANNDPYQEKLAQLGQRLKQLRVSAGYTNYETFAIEHNFSRGLYWKYEKGQHDLRFTTLVRLAQAHKMTVSELLNEVIDNV
jgi:transcriptional regulator with XRE-family HTH domain